MYTIISFLYGVMGLVIGYKIPNLSFKIMEYKKCKENLTKNDNFLYSKWFQLLLCLINGVVWSLAGLRMANPLIAFLITTQFTLGLIVAYIDINIRIIPNELVLTIVILGIIFQTVNYSLWALLTAIISMVVMMVVFMSVAGFVGFGKVGAGDVKLAGAMGLALGYPLIITGVGIMAIVLFVFILIGLALKKIYLSTMLPLAPFLIAGYVFSLVTLIIN